MELLNHVKVEKKMKDKYFIYVRKSTKPEDRQIESIPDQIKTLQMFAKSHKYDVVETFIESGSAWSDDSRIVFDSMLEKAKIRGDIKGILFRYIDRASRNLIEGGYLYKLVESGVIDEIITPDAVFNRNNFFYYGIELLKAKSYSDDISIKVRASVIRRIENGIPIHHPLPGYMFDPKAPKGRKIHIPNPNTYPLMEKLFAMFLTGDYSVNQILKISEEMGIENSLGRKISHTRMYEILKSPYYCGRFMNSGKEYQGIHQRMLSEEQHKKILEILVKQSKPKGEVREFAFNSILKCSDCNCAYYGESHFKHYKNGNVQEFRYYRPRVKKGNCNHKYIREDVLEKKVSESLAKFQMGTDFIDWYYKWAKTIKGKEIVARDSTLSLLNNELNAVNRKIDHLMDDRFSGDSMFDKEELDEKYRKLKIERKNIEDSITKVGTYSDEINELTLKTFVFAERAKLLFAKGTPEKKRRVLLGVCTNLFLKGENIWIQPQIPVLMIESAVRKLNRLKALHEPEQTVSFEAINEVSNSTLSVWRGIRNDIRTYYLGIPSFERQQYSAMFINA